MVDRCPIASPLGAAARSQHADAKTAPFDGSVPSGGTSCHCTARIAARRDFVRFGKQWSCQIVILARDAQQRSLPPMPSTVWRNPCPAA
jgi:hypothetical protein